MARSAPETVLSGEAVPEADPLFSGPGEMRALCRQLDWTRTGLGPSREWSQSLRATVGLLLGSRNPMFLFWGPELIQIYNDAYRPSLGGGGPNGRHPRALGARGREFWTDIWDAIGPQIEQVLHTGVATWHEDQYLPIERNGRLEDVWWTYSYGPVHDDDGRINGVLVVCQETTSRMRVQQALRESEARYRALFESMDEGFCVLEVLFDDGEQGIDCRFLEVNPAFVAQTGLHGATGRRMRELAPAPEEYWYETYARVVRTGEPIRFEAPADALDRWYDVYAFRIGAAQDHRVAVLFKDVTAARKAAQERERLLAALAVERARLVEVFRQAPSFLAVLRGPEHVFELVNDAYYRIVGHRELVGRPVHQALPEVSDQGFVQLLDRVLQTREPYIGHEVPVRLARTPGVSEERYVDFVYQPLMEPDGSCSGVIAHGSDVTEQVRARREVERLLAESEAARAEAESANRVKAEFLTTMSHELRTPLNAIGGYTDLLALEIHGPLTAAQRQDLDRIRHSQRHLLGLINEVLNFAKLETGAVHFDIGKVSVRAAIADACDLVAPQAEAKELQMGIDDCGPLLASADPEKLRQVLVNLLSNAVKFTAPGGRVEATCTADDAWTYLHVRDTGIGIAADKIEAIFDPFVQVRSDYARPHDGTGLGLAISRDLARAMGGDITAESTPGAGSCFTITLPRA